MNTPNYHAREDFFHSNAVLVVEDDLQSQVYIDRLLRAVDQDLTIDRVATAEEARDLLGHSTEDHYDLVIADQFLKGGETGLDLWRHCRKWHPFLEFILISGSDIDRYLNQFGVRIRPPVFLKKPLNVGVTQTKISECLESAQAGLYLRRLLLQDELDSPLTLATTPLKHQKKNWYMHTVWGCALVLYCACVITYAFMAWSSQRQSFRDLMRTIPTTESPSDNAQKLKNFVPQKPIPINPTEIWDYQIPPNLS